MPLKKSKIGLQFFKTNSPSFIFFSLYDGCIERLENGNKEKKEENAWRNQQKSRVGMSQSSVRCKDEEHYEPTKLPETISRKL